MTTTAQSQERTLTQEHSNTPNRLRGPKGLLLVGAISASAAILTACATEVQAKPEPVPTQEVPVGEAPVEGVGNETEEEPITTGSFEIPSGLEAREVATVVTDIFNDWTNASAETDLLKFSLSEGNADKSWDELLPELVAANAAERADDLLVTGWEENPKLTAVVNGFSTANLNVLQWYVATEWSDKPENTEGFKSWMTIEDATELPDDNPDDNRRTIDIVTKENTNSDKNTGPAPVREGGAMTIVLEDQGDGTEKITDLTVR